MNIGIIVHSKTGNTLSVAERLKERLEPDGNTVTIERVIPENDDPAAAAKSPLKESPDTTPYEMLIFAAPVWAFSLSTVMKKYLDQLPDLQGKKVNCFVTHQFPYAWLGGNRAISQMKKALSGKGVNVNETGVVNWSNKERERNISEVIEKLSKI